ncbi:von Willebrand factor A domain-containing protein 2-like [Ylistrum balloti]|uniref:von Willebrand factor A domain-containing protein 2-like n=1 Tax=Ylistrum balloti TaxID=509963 RepID=UPI002905B285|nr:von Willebrand factor A domain-containing protein 2-like [Ylistrum balloti]
MSTMKEMTVIAVICLLTEVTGHAGHKEASHHFLSKSMAMAFIPQNHWLNRRSATQCQNNEPYCESNKMECMNYVESNREHFCAIYPGHCGIGYTCYLSVPCPAHFELGCSVDPCYDSPCENGGTCNNEGGSNFTCSCTYGYYGSVCEYDDSCLSDPCLNGGMCNRVASNYDCSCTNRYIGTVCETDCRPGPADILFIMDASFRAEKQFSDSKAIVTSIVNKLSIGIDDFQVAILKYSFDVSVEFSFNTYTNKTAMIAAIDNITAIAGPSYLDKALDKAKEIFSSSSTFGARSQVLQYTIIISDGLSTLRTEAVYDAQVLRSQGVKILAIGNGEQVDQTELLQLATASQYVFPCGKEDNVADVIFMETVSSNCTDCALHTMVDILFLVDVSKHQMLLQQTLDTVKDLLYKATEYNSNTYVGMATFDLTTQFKFSLNQYTDRDAILLNSQIGLSSTNRNSNVSAALEFARESGFTGSRSDARKILVMFSNEGWSDRDEIVQQRESLSMNNVTVAFVTVGRSADLETAFTVAERASDVFYIEQNTDLVRLYALVAQTAYVECPDNIFDIRL